MVNKDHIEQAIKKFIEEKTEHPEPKSCYLVSCKAFLNDFVVFDNTSISRYELLINIKESKEENIYSVVCARM